MASPPDPDRQLQRRAGCTRARTLHPPPQLLRLQVVFLSTSSIIGGVETCHRLTSQTEES